MSRPDGAANPAADDAVHDDDLQPEAPDALVEVEHEGDTYAVPAALKGALMRHEDYTRKTQALEAGHQALAQAAATMHGNLCEHGRVALLGDQIAQLSRLNWPALQQQNPVQAQQLMTQLFQMRQAHEIAAGRLQHQAAVAAFERQRDHARRVEEGHATLAREIDGWSPQMAGRLAQYAIGQGISPEELNELSDPRLVKILAHAYAGHAVEQQAAAAQRLTKAQAVRPAIEVGGAGGGPTDPNRMSTDDWMRHRRGQIRSKTR